MNDKVSIFKTFNSAPEKITLGRWIRQTMNRKSAYANKVLAHRETGDVSIKKSLPLATVGAVCEGGRKMEDVVNRTGWIALDIDAKDNEHLPGAEVIRDAIAKIVYVAFAGLSVSGQGVWALVKVADPQKQKFYFEQLQRDFKSRGVILDSTKGKNANDARFYSYDPQAYVADDFKIYDRLPKPQPVRQTYTPSFLNDTDKYAAAALKSELEILSSTGEGNRNNQLFKSAAALAQLVAGGVLNERDVRSALFDVGLSIGLPKHEVSKTIESGFRAGMKNPRQPSNNRQGITPKRKDNGTQRKYGSDFEPPSTGNGVKLNKQGYPSSWDEIEMPDPGTDEFQRCERIARQDGYDFEHKTTVTK